MQNPAQALRLWQHLVADLALEGLPCDASVAVQVVIGTVLEGYQTLSKIASQQTFKPNQKIQQVSTVLDGQDPLLSELLPSGPS